MEASLYVQDVERKVSPPNPLVKAKLDWPFEPRKKRKLQPNEVAEIKNLLAHVDRGNMEISDITAAFGVSPSTLRRIKSKRVHSSIKQARWLAPAKKAKR